MTINDIMNTTSAVISIADRIAIYKLGIEYLNEKARLDIYNCLCYTLTNAIYRHYVISYIYSYDQVFAHVNSLNFPEFFKYQPEGLIKYQPWFGGVNITNHVRRMEVIKDCLAKAEAELKSLMI